MYFRCGTKGNKIGWIAFGVLFTVGLAFWIPGLVEFRKMGTVINECATTTNCGANVTLTGDPYASGGALPASCTCFEAPDGVVSCSTNSIPASCFEQYQDQMRTPAVIWSIGWFLLVCSLFPLFYFCCCSKPPVSLAMSQLYTERGPMYSPSSPLELAQQHPYAATRPANMI